MKQARIRFSFVVVLALFLVWPVASATRAQTAAKPAPFESLSAALEPAYVPLQITVGAPATVVRSQSAPWSSRPTVAAWYGSLEMESTSPQSPFVTAIPQLA